MVNKPDRNDRQKEHNAKITDTDNFHGGTNRWFENRNSGTPHAYHQAGAPWCNMYPRLRSQCSLYEFHQHKYRLLAVITARIYQSVFEIGNSFFKYIILSRKTPYMGFFWTGCVSSFWSGDKLLNKNNYLSRNNSLLKNQSDNEYQGGGNTRWGYIGAKSFSAAGFENIIHHA
ncbi:MAG: hypothetical protein A2176_12895 [Spirochaetes bacterium RBG_13_51_14]|nr:MAG: hypothetical protein A2176_12895 [Spirochaetes bacterium RBG_13_51_14]